jgi:hypothetical protein
LLYQVRYGYGLSQKAFHFQIREHLFEFVIIYIKSSDKADLGLATPSEAELARRKRLKEEG